MATVSIPHPALPLDATAGVCEDDDQLRDVLRRALERDGFKVRATASGTEAVRSFAERPLDVLVLDVGLPDADGRDVCQALRAQGVTTPVLFLTARDALPDRLSGFHAGGDDYLTKPFELAELLVRVRALVRRRDAVRSPDVDGGFRLEPATHSIVCGETSVDLTPTEFRMLATLLARRGDVVRRTSLVEAAWPEGAIVHDQTVHAYLARIRRKLREAGASVTIETRRGVGYRLT